MANSDFSGQTVRKYQRDRKLALSKDRDITPAEFMLRTNKGNKSVTIRKRVWDEEEEDYIYEDVLFENTAYSSTASAARAYRKLKQNAMGRGGTSGANIAKRQQSFTYGEGEKTTLGPARGGREEGLWKIVVHYNWKNESGDDMQPDTKSIIVRSSEYDDYSDAVAVELETGDYIDTMLADWSDMYGMSSYSVTNIEVIHIQHTNSIHAVSIG